MGMLLRRNHKNMKELPKSKPVKKKPNTRRRKPTAENTEK